MIDNYNCLPFYGSLAEQNHRKTYAYGQVFPIYAPQNRLLPFQLRARHLDSTTPVITLIDFNTGEETDITTAAQEGLQIVTGTDCDTIVYCPVTSWDIAPNIGRYYVRVEYGTQQVWWSEVFTIVADLSGYVRVEWHSINDQPLTSGAILYEGVYYRNVMYFATELGKPEYTYEEEGENRDGWYFAEKQISSKTFKFTFPATECICDALRLARLADFVRVRDQYGHTYDCDTFLITPQWQEQGDVAEVVAEFTTGTIVKHIGTGYTAGDYNDDYNDDYNID